MTRGVVSSALSSSPSSLSSSAKSGDASASATCCGDPACGSTAGASSRGISSRGASSGGATTCAASATGAAAGAASAAATSAATGSATGAGSGASASAGAATGFAPSAISPGVPVWWLLCSGSAASWAGRSEVSVKCGRFLRRDSGGMAARMAENRRPARQIARLPFQVRAAYAPPPPGNQADPAGRCSKRAIVRRRQQA